MEQAHEVKALEQAGAWDQVAVVAGWVAVAWVRVENACARVADTGLPIAEALPAIRCSARNADHRWQGEDPPSLKDETSRKLAPRKEMRLGNMAAGKSAQGKTIRERMEEEEMVREREDAQGHRWRKVYFGGGQYFKNCLAQCKELGEVMVEEVDPTGYKWFEEGGEKLYRIWLKAEETEGDDLF